MHLFNRLWSDDSGAIIAVEYLLLTGVVVAGVVVGMEQVRDSINGEYQDLGNAYRGVVARSIAPAACRPGSGAARVAVPRALPVFLPLDPPVLVDADEEPVDAFTPAMVPPRVSLKQVPCN